MKNNYIEALIFLNGDMPSRSFAKNLVNDTTYLIGCDGGVDHIYSLGLKPHAVIGDFDSARYIPNDIKNLDVGHYEKEIVIDDVAYIKYQSEKDYLDGELALIFALRRGFKQINLICNLSSETDHILGNIFLLGKPEYTGVNLRILQPNLEMFVAQGNVKLKGKPGQKLSLIPLFGEVKVASSKGLKYDPAKYQMTVETNSGISNEFTNQAVEIKITAGKFLTVIYKK